MIAHATPLGGCLVTITNGEQVEYQCEAGYHVKLERKFGSKPDACHEKKHADPKQLVQTSEDPVNAVSSCRHVDPFEQRFASWIVQHDRLFPSHEWLEDWSRARRDEMLQWTVLVTCSPGTGKTTGVRLFSGHVRETFLEYEMRKVKNANSLKLIMKGQGVFARHRLPS